MNGPVPYLYGTVQIVLACLARFGDTATSHFNSLTVPLCASETHPAATTYNFAVADRAADPDAQLFINEIFTEKPGVKAEAFYQLVADLISAGTPIDGVGIQGHIQFLSGPLHSQHELREYLERFAALGVVVELTEADVTQRAGDLVPQADILGVPNPGPLLFDEAFHPKPAYRVVLESLQGR